MLLQAYIMTWTLENMSLIKNGKDLEFHFQQSVGTLILT